MEEQVAAGFTLGKTPKGFYIYNYEGSSKACLERTSARKMLRKLRTALVVLLCKTTVADTKSHSDFGFLYLENRISKNQTK